jgi:hypothetical protein
MSYDLAVWYPHQRLSNANAGELYVGLCEVLVEPPAAHPAVDAFYRELTARFPEIDTIPEARVDDHDFCPWTSAIDRSPGHLIMGCVSPKAEQVDRFVTGLAFKHGLAVFNPQSGIISYPDSAAQPWGKFWR